MAHCQEQSDLFPRHPWCSGQTDDFSAKWMSSCKHNIIIVKLFAVCYTITVWCAECQFKSLNDHRLVPTPTGIMWDAKTFENL